MYGTIMRGSVRPEDRAALVAAIEAGESVAVPGFLGSRLLIPDERADEVWLAVFFTDRLRPPSSPAEGSAPRPWIRYLPVASSSSSRNLAEISPICATSSSWTAARSSFRPLAM